MLARAAAVTLALALVAIPALMADSANHGFTVRDAGANGQMPQDFHSREKGTDNPPRLVLTFAP